MAARREPPSKGIALGRRVTLRLEAFDREQHKHLRSHALYHDLGTVVDARYQPWGHWVFVRFDDCPTTHRVAETEIAFAPG